MQQATKITLFTDTLNLQPTGLEPLNGAITSKKNWLLWDVAPIQNNRLSTHTFRSHSKKKKYQVCDDVVIMWGAWFVQRHSLAWCYHPKSSSFSESVVPPSAPTPNPHDLSSEFRGDCHGPHPIAKVYTTYIFQFLVEWWTICWTCRVFQQGLIPVTSPYPEHHHLVWGCKLAQMTLTSFTANFLIWGSCCYLPPVGMLPH